VKKRGKKGRKKNCLPTCGEETWFSKGPGGLKYEEGEFRRGDTRKDPEDRRKLRGGGKKG